ncbi:MAG: type II toxin-antitoxin system YafQ family toxin [Oscillospiraceae bacterium]|nr:type II toxin-antitoxin system YafQ family toxin [Oscillospiraceae bacterium]
MLIIKYHSSFKKDYKRIEKRGYDTRKLSEIINILANEKTLSEKHRDHYLSGNYIGCKECHITNDWLLIYEIDESERTLYLTRTGTHSDLF